MNVLTKARRDARTKVLAICGESGLRPAELGVGEQTVIAASGIAVDEKYFDARPRRMADRYCEANHVDIVECDIRYGEPYVSIERIMEVTRG